MGKVVRPLRAAALPVTFPGGPLPSADIALLPTLYGISSFNAPSAMSSRILTNIENIYKITLSL